MILDCSLDFAHSLCSDSSIVANTPILMHFPFMYYYSRLGAGHSEIVEKLVLSGKVDVNATNGRGDSALHKVRSISYQLSYIH